MKLAHGFTAFASLAAVFFVACMLSGVESLNNGLARTPPMGWLVWERFRCNVDCENDPANCISETLFMQMADHFVSDGYLSAGYNTIIIDDCWMNTTRLANGTLLADPKRFPHGIAALADYVHARGIKLGIYQDYGTQTCGGYPGIIGYVDTDAETYASWGIDYVKMDGCNSDPTTMDGAYPYIGSMLNATGRPMVYSCSWPDYLRASGLPINYTLIGEHCNLWRLYYDIDDDWESVSGIIEYWGENQETLIAAAAPGRWNDMVHMLIIGDFGLSKNESQTQMALWSILASPLLMSNDLRNISSFAKDILLNPEVIAVSQDPLGQQGARVSGNGTAQVWARFLHDGTFAFALYNSGETPQLISASFHDFGFYTANVRDLFARRDLGVFSGTYQSTVSPHGVSFVRVSPLRM